MKEEKVRVDKKEKVRVDKKEKVRVDKKEKVRVDKKEEERTLTLKEKIRLEKVQEIRNTKESEGYEVKELTVGIVYANIMALIIATPICVIFGVYFLLFSPETILNFSLTKYFICLIVITLSIVIHELLHGLSWGIFAKHNFKMIEFGFIKEYLTPYCTCLEPLSKIQYIIGVAMPGFILGIIPMIISIFIGHIPLLIYGMLMTLAAGGDATILLKILTNRSDKREQIYIDHPTKCGVILFQR